MSDRYWHQVGPCRFDHEREALAFVRERLPDHEPWRAWANFEFIAPDGSINEVDLLVLAKSGLYLVEIKGHRGIVRGDQGTFRFRTPDRAEAVIDNPLFLANLKSKRLKSLVQSAKAFNKKPAPYIEPLVFLSHAAGCELSPPADTRIALRDGEASAGRSARPGIVAALRDRHAPGLPSQSKTPGDRPLAKTLERAFKEIGIGPARARHRIKDYEIFEPIEETAVWRDSLARHVSIAGTVRRVRQYFASPEGQIERHRLDDAARREFHLLERLEHPGILRSTDYTLTEQGPVLFLEDTTGLDRLDRYLTTHGNALSIDDRLELIRQIAEPVRYAHGRQVVHRCLGPHSVLVAAGDGGRPKAVKISNWQSGTTDATTVASYVHATLHPESYQDVAASVYLAPELRRDPASTDTALDVFSLGALAYLVLTGRPPAESPEALYEAIEDGGLEVSAVVDGTAATIDELVSRATHPNVSQRTPTVADFLKGIDAIEEELTRPEAQCAIPPQAHAGDTLPDGTRIVNRLGSGATAVAFLVDRPAATGPERCVLKVASDAHHSDHLAREAEIVRTLAHPNIVRYVASFEAGGYQGFFGRPANDQTLRQRLQAEGALQLELLERFGRQLLEALVYLEDAGIAHRDVKPDNIGVTDFERRQALGIILFDFSLSASPADNLRAGTPAYADPFLEQRPTRRWDLHAERFSAAMTLHEMATGVLPRWGDGRSDPRATQGEVVLDGNRFPPGVRDHLLEFFRRGLARAPEGRFDNAAQMLEAWNDAFKQTEHRPAVETPDDVEHLLDERLAAQGSRTPASELPLSTRAANALDRMSVFTIDQLLRMPPNWLLRTRGVGAKTRGELEDLVRRLRRRYPEIEIDPSAARARRPDGTGEDAGVEPALDPAATVDELLQHLRAAGHRLTKTQARFMDILLGLDPDAADDDPLAPLPTQTEAAAHAGVSRQRISQIMGELRRKWTDLPVARSIAGEIAGWLDRNGGIMTLDEAAETLVSERASAHEGRRAERMARAVIRAVSESESQQPEPAWQFRRREERQYLATSDAHVRYAEGLAARARSLAALDTLPARAEVERALAEVSRPEGVAPIPAGRLARLAASACSGVELSRRGELYPAGMPPARSVRLAMGTLVGAGRSAAGVPGRRIITPDDIERQVRKRYPAAAPLPAPTQLLSLLRGAGWDVEWSDEHGAFLARTGETVSVESGSTTIPRFPTAGSTTEPVSPELRVADEFERRVRDVIDGRKFLILKTEPKYLERAAEELVHRFGDLESIDLDERILAAIDAARAENRVNEETFYAAEAAGRDDPVRWSRVMTIIASAIDRLTAELTSGETPVLLRHVGLLARYGRWAPIEKLNSLYSGGSPRACLVLIPGDVSVETPIIDGEAVPHLGGQCAIIPEPWLQNLLRATAS